MIELLLSYGFNTLEYSWVKATIGICMLADYSVAKKCQQAFCRRCWGSQLILSIYRVNRIQLVNTISLCRIIFCFVLFVVLTEMCYTGFDHPVIYHTVRLLVNRWKASTIGHDLKLLIENLSDHWTASIIIIIWRTGTLGHHLRRSLMDPSSRYGKTFRIIIWSISRWKTGLSSRNFFGLSWVVRGHIDVEAWRSLYSENGFPAKAKMMNSSDLNTRGPPHG
jgi:hypothetical protein